MKLKAQKRELLGKKVKHLRAEGLVPATIYGPKREATNIQFDEKTFKKVFDKVGYNKFIELEIEGEKPTRVLVKEVNFDPIKDNIMDISIYDVDEDRKVSVEVPIEITGESPAVKLKLGFLVQQTTAVAVYCLPKDLPGEFKVSIESIETTSDTISLSDLDLPEGVEFDSSVDPNSAIVYIATDQKEIVEDEIKDDEAGEGEGGVEGESTEGEKSEGEE